MTEILRLDSVKKSYGDRLVLNRVSLSIGRAEVIVVRGRSGAGKTTLLKIIALLLKPDEGRVYVDGVDAWRLREKERGRVASRLLSYIPQTIDLLPNMTVRENIELAGYVRGLRGKGLDEAVSRVAELVGISKLLERRVENLSGGEKQMVALARGLVNSPALVVADEPFAYVDDAGIARLYDLIEYVKNELKTSFIISTTEIYQKSFNGDREYILADGKLVEIQDM
ncbi:ABC transporter ATP-binding protein [Thermogladius sp. 4427co]|uniref:ABC transporter ATP-binding protein n=1 Tax=Thermogladius sp. 4427co TaxID=3450718 RepID=UPI003F7A2DBF